MEKNRKVQQLWRGSEAGIEKHGREFGDDEGRSRQFRFTRGSVCRASQIPR